MSPIVSSNNANDPLCRLFLTLGAWSFARYVQPLTHRLRNVAQTHRVTGQSTYRLTSMQVTVIF
jgi:hypothetical protein